ncbi:MAG: cofactor-independent phosphoglycerate mutase [Planctomycetaceae bacterium]|nr:cofactor-independent phosphoglycerate mutase [Planctomycetaceae bacterium]
MKFVLVIPDGCADEPQSVLGNRTPLQAAHTPHMDEIARLGVVGRSDNVPASLPSGSDVATMSLFGYDPLQYHTGRAPLEAAAQGIPLGGRDWAIRCNFVTIENGHMKSFTAGQIPTALAHRLIDRLQQRLGDEHWEFHAGVSYRNLLIHRPAAGRQAPFSRETRSTPPHDLTDQPVACNLPTGPGSDVLLQLMDQSQPIVSADPTNAARTREGELATTGIWLWGLGQQPALDDFHARFGKWGAMITAVDLLRGIASLLGWKNIQVPGATGYLDTDYVAKGQYAIRALDDVDLVVVHVEATDEASHEGDVRAKVESLERIDRDLVGPIHAHLRSRGNYRILVSPDHPTFLRTKTHSHGHVPFALCGTGITPDAASTYDEATAAQSILAFDRGHELMPYFLHSTRNLPAQ